MNGRATPRAYAREPPHSKHVHGPSLSSLGERASEVYWAAKSLQKPEDGARETHSETEPEDARHRSCCIDRTHKRCECAARLWRNVPAAAAADDGPGPAECKAFERRRDGHARRPQDQDLGGVREGLSGPARS